MGHGVENLFVVNPGCCHILLCDSCKNLCMPKDNTQAGALDVAQTTCSVYINTLLAGSL